MGWNGYSGNGGEGWNHFDVVVLPQLEAEEDARRAAEWEAAKAVAPPPLTFREGVKQYASTLSEKEAKETISFVLEIARDEGWLPQLINLIRNEGLLEETDVRVQAAALEDAKNALGY